MTDSQAALLAQFSRVAYGDSVSIPNTWAPLPGFSDLALIACDLELTGVRVDLAGIASEGLGYFPWMG